MPKVRSILSVAILAAHAGLLSAADHVKMLVTWKNASAEELQQGLLPISRFAEMTVVDDGKATLYFKGADALEVAMVIRREAAENLPKDLAIVSTITERGDIPTAPVPSSQSRFTIHLSADKASKFGITTSDLGVQLAKLQATRPDDLNAAFDTAVFSLPDGKKVPVRDLAEIRLTEVKRPLVSRKP